MSDAQTPEQTALAMIARAIRQELPQLTQALRVLAQTVEPIVKPIVIWFGVYEMVTQITEKTGWLPHRSVPIERYLGEHGSDVDKVIAAASSHYENNEESILSAIESQLQTYSVNDESKETLREAIAAHRHALYRCSCRVLLPEIERVLREDWLGITHVATVNQKEITAAIAEGYLEDFVRRSPEDLVLFKYLKSHLFETVHDYNREQIIHDPVPNRHAASHGWIPYASAKK